MSIIWLGMPHCQKGICGLKPAQVNCSLWNAFASCLIFMLYDELNHIFTLTSLTPPVQVRLTQVDSCIFLTNSERTFALPADPLNWQNGLSGKRTPSFSNCLKIKSASLQQLWSFTLASFPELHEHVNITFAHLHWAFFNSKGLLLSHSKQSQVSTAPKEHFWNSMFLLIPLQSLLDILQIRQYIQ